MIAFTKLLRRTAVALSAIAALTVTGLATAQTVTLSGTTTNSCTYSQMTATAGTANLTFTCGSSTVATLALSAVPTQLPQSLPANITIKRTGLTTTDAVVDLNVTGNCALTTAGDTPLTIPASTTTKTFSITTLLAPGTCTVALAPRDPAVAGTPASASINVVDPDSDVVFAFAATDTIASAGGGPVSITLNRAGGTNGSFTVAITVPPTPALLGAIAPTSFTFAANQLSAAVVYTPPATNVTGLPNTWVLGLGTITKGATNPPLQSASVSATAGTNNLAVGLKSTTCNAFVNPTPGLAEVPTISLASGGMYTFQLPRTSQRKISGSFKLSSTTSSFPVSPWNYEFQISKCAGQIDPGVGGTCYISSSNSAQLSLNWFESLPLAGTAGATAGYGTIAGLQAKGACWAPATEGPWYVNIRYNYADCNIASHMCGWKGTWYNYSY
jgi:hypothetical protein